MLSTDPTSFAGMADLMEHLALPEDEAGNCATGFAVPPDELEHRIGRRSCGTERISLWHDLTGGSHQP
jgi:hypothetical protein